MVGVGAAVGFGRAWGLEPLGLLAGADEAELGLTEEGGRLLAAGCGRGSPVHPAARISAASTAAT